MDVIETKCNQFWKKLTCSYKLRPKVQFCILRHPTGFYRSHHNSKWSSKKLHYFPLCYPFILLQELFRKVNPQHCLGSIWSRRDKKNKSCDVSSVKATINQFNSVCNCVMTTVLADTDMKPCRRAKIICKWIETAQVCSRFYYTCGYYVKEVLMSDVKQKLIVWNACDCRNIFTKWLLLCHKLIFHFLLH